MFVTSWQNSRRQGKSGWSAAKFDLKNFLASRFNEYGGEKFRVGLHEPAMRSFFSLARKTDCSCGSVHKASDKHSLTGTFSRCVLCNFIKQFIGSNHVTSLSIDSVEEMTLILDELTRFINSLFHDSLILVFNNQCSTSDFVLFKVVTMQVILCRDPTDVDCNQMFNIMRFKYS